MTVRILEEHVVNQIAAGEVVERPASVVRELFQNALDAGATAIEVSLRNGGMAGIRITDDGVGMNRTDAMMALERHATSKIHRAEDLQGVSTLGFRGEALPSIAAVSRFELKTRLHDEDEGTRIRVEGGTLRDVRAVGCAPGTEIDVRSLFFNLPARRKFLRTRTTELNHCVAAVTREVLVRPELDVVVRHEERDVLRAPRCRDVGERVRAILGDVGQSLIEIDEATGPVHVRGMLSPVGVHRSSAASSVYLYVNGRYVTDRLIRRAVYEAYRERVPRGRYPVVVLDLRLDPGLVDVNVHPTKTEVRFTHPREVAQAVSHAVRGRVDQAGATVIRRDPSLASAAPGPLFSPPLPLGPGSPSGPPPPSPAPPPQPVPAHPDDDPRLRDVPPTDVPVAVAPTDKAWRRVTVLGGLADRWIVGDAHGQLVLVDVIAARRSLWITRARTGDSPLGPAQRLLAPARVGLRRTTADRIEAVQDVLGRLGVEVDRFAPTEVAIRGLPAELGPVEPSVLLDALADAHVRGGDAAVADALCGVAARVAPFPAEPHEQRTLLAVLDEVGLPWGPPICARWSEEEIARKLRGGR